MGKAVVITSRWSTVGGSMTLHKAVTKELMKSQFGSKSETTLPYLSSSLLGGWM